MGRKLHGTLFKRGDTYWYRYRYQGHQYAHSLKTGKQGYARREMQRRMSMVIASTNDGTFFERHGKGVVPEEPVQNGRLRLGDAWQRYIQCRTRPQSGQSTLEEYQCQMGVFVSWMAKRFPQVGHLSGVTPEIACKFLTYLETDRHLSPGTFNKYIDTLRRTFRVLKSEAHALEANPWEGIPHKKASVNRRKRFSPDVVTLILTTAVGWMRTLFYLGFYTGQRLVDCSMLKWEDVDFENNVVEVVPRKTRNSSGIRVELPMHTDLRRHLDELRGTRTERMTGFILPEVVALYNRDPSAVVVPIREFLKSCGLRVHKEGTGENGIRAVPVFGFHSCRHTFVSVCRNAHIADSVVQSIVGDSYRLYSHVDRDDKQRAIDQLPSLIKRSAAGDAQDAAPQPYSSLSDEELQRMLKATQVEAERRRIAAAKALVA